MPNTKLNMSAEKQHRLMEWWSATESAKPVVQRLMSLISELRLNPESSRADGMILFYRAASEISYGYAGIRGCLRRVFAGEYNESIWKNMELCQGFARKFSVDTKILLERVAKQVSGPNALQLIDRIRKTLAENDEMLDEIERRARAFYKEGNR
jgi:hypothetical protein